MRMIRIFTAVSILLISFFCNTINTNAQSFDYETKPRLDFGFLHAGIDLQVQPDDLGLKGSVEYTLRAHLSSADSLYLKAVGLKIDSVLTNRKTSSFETKNDMLIIPVTDSAVVGQQYQVEIFYHGTPDFGLLKTSEGSIWTSALPRTLRHWVPSVDHPAVNLVNELSLTVPDNYVVSATGVKTGEEDMADDKKRWTFRTGRPVPVTSVRFAIGHFNQEDSSYGIKQINTYAEPYTVTPGRQRTLANDAASIIRSAEEVAGVEYPYQRLNIVILNDHSWETKPYGASTVFLYQNRGDWLNQLRRGIYAQWFGVYQHEAQWAGAWPIQLFQTAMHFKMADKKALLQTASEPRQSFTTVYENFDVAHWNWWQGYQDWPYHSLQETAERIIPQIIQQGPGTYTPTLYEDLWYRFSGQPSINIPGFESPSSSNSKPDTTVIYRVDYEMMPDQQSLQLIFTAQKGQMASPVKLSAEVIGGAANASFFSVSGTSDTVAVAVPAGTQNVMLRVEKPAGVQLVEHKPISFLLYQLRNAKSIEAKRQAAIQIGYHADNPDLQLALTDLMEQPLEPEVKASLLRSFGAITDGATGTQNRFLNALNTDNALLQSAALDVLQNYPNDPQVTQRLRQFSENTSDDELARRAMKLYMGRLDSSQALSYVNAVVQQDTAGTNAVAAISYLAKQGKANTAVNLAQYYIEPVYSFAVRKQAFEVLLTYDTSAEAWQERVEMLLGDPDPRIRFITVKNIRQIPGINPAAVLQQHRPFEYDARVLQVIKNQTVDSMSIKQK